ncbi:helix-turn-helix transcriptional regulator [Archangium lansingense]|uniref:Helix-turn-helix transcriptional regulator n=1 Tax=Archangium lansingense TaxID=2995310 RepID=A0ABT4AHE3_9BACT|nr:helix-turn-helix transcriptional regulator [Archangium lansinium]MCY1080614.1 helix-turn-helix transcriptional regulator [Archangium lansinium]
MKNSTHLTKKKLTVHLGEMLKEARLKAELTQADVAERVGVVTEVYGRMERGHLTPSVLTLRKLCMVLRVDASAALGLQAGEAAAWLKESEPTPEESPQMRRLLRTLRQLDDKQLSAVGYMARSLVQPEAR